MSNWNAARLERQRGAEFAKRLVADLREEAWIFQYHIETTATCWPALSGARDPGRTDSRVRRVAAINAYRATQYRRSVERATYDELTSTAL